MIVGRSATIDSSHIDPEEPVASGSFVGLGTPKKGPAMAQQIVRCKPELTRPGFKGNGKPRRLK
jgi:hypothetical protein